MVLFQSLMATMTLPLCPQLLILHLLLALETPKYIKKRFQNLIIAR